MARMTAGERRAVLVGAAIAVMKRQGVANTSTRDIVAEADMQIGVFHYCFESKEQLIREVMSAINERTNTAVGEGLADVEPGPAFIQAAVSAYWHHIEADPDEHLLTYELTAYALRNLRSLGSPAGPGDAADAAGDVVSRLRRRVSDDAPADAAVSQYRAYLFTMVALLTMLADVCSTTWTTPVSELARVTLATVEGITLQWLVDGDDACAKRSLALLADMLARDARLL